MLGTIVEQALGSDVARIAEEIRARQDAGRYVDSEAWRTLFRLLASDQDVVNLAIGERVLLAIAERACPAPVRAAAVDWVPSGRIGSVDLSRGCYSYCEVWTLAAVDLVRTGRDRAAEALLRSGSSVRDLLRRFYGIVMVEAAFDDAAEARAFPRTLDGARKSFTH
jgi:hypothetical protein